MSRKKPYQKKPFESTGANTDISANLYLSMLTSPAFMDLSASQKTLYMYCKLQYYGEKRKPNNDLLAFTMNRAKVMKYGLYSAGNLGKFIRDTTSLIEHGFISCSECGAVTRTKNVYRFSDKWQQWGTSDFHIDVDEMNYPLIKAYRKQNNEP